MKLQEIEKPVYPDVQVANGLILECNKNYQAIMTFSRKPHCKLYVELWVLENLPVDIDLGLQWLSNKRRNSRSLIKYSHDK